MTEMNDMELAREFARRNSESAFAELVRRHINLVYSVAMRYVGNSSDAQDVTQAVFIILAKKAPGLRDKTIITGWLYETTRFTATNFLRSKIRRESREQEAYMQSTLNDSETDNAWQQVAPLLEDAMTRLSEKERTLLALNFFENKSGAETAAALGIEEWAARKRVARAVEKLRKFFTKRGIGVSAGVLVGAITANSVQAAPVALATSISALAITKGAVASGSTLTLVKGALKLMAWTKAKVAAATSAAILLATITTVTVTSHFRNAPPTQTGRLKLPTGNVTPMVGYGYSRYAIFLASDGSLWSWGEERLGSPVLGLDKTNIQNTASLRRIGHDTDWVNIAVGDSHCLAIKSDGTLWAWGGNFASQLGDGTKITRATPVSSIPGNDWKQAAAGGAESFALKNDGSLWAWGNNWAGQLGIGSAKESNKAVQVGTSTNWTKIWAGDLQTVGLQSDGSLWFWGSFSGDSKDKKTFLVPTRISPDTNWTDVCLGYYTIFAIKSDGTLWSWGLKANFYTDAADASLNRTPMQVGKESDWQSCSSMAGGFYHVLMRKDGSLWALDASEHRQVKPVSEYKPIKLRKIDLHKDIVAFTGGDDDIGAVLTRDGEVWTWGKVIGEHSPKDHFGPKGESLFPKSKTIDKPWQLSNLD